MTITRRKWLSSGIRQREKVMRVLKRMNTPILTDTNYSIMQ